MVGILPFVEQQALWEQISNPNDRNVTGVQSPPWPAMGPAPWLASYIPWSTEVSTYRCPSDPGTGLPAMGRTNYAACLGDNCMTSFGPWDPWTGNLRWATVLQNDARAHLRGFFKPMLPSSFRDILDGLANTIAAGEINTDLGDRDITTIALNNPGQWWTLVDNVHDCRSSISQTRPRFWADTIVQVTGSTWPGDNQLDVAANGRGFMWANGEPLWTGFTTIKAPNTELCSIGRSADELIGSASSRHQGGAHVLMGDGAVKFITNSIDTGSGIRQVFWDHTSGPTVPGSPSPFGLWGRLGTRANKEIIDREF